MKFISHLLLCFVLFCSCTSKQDVTDPYQLKAPYKLLNLFSVKIKPITGLVLTGYAFNWCLPEGYKIEGIGNFSVTYSLPKTKNDEISLEYARNLIVFLGENLLQDINADPDVRSDLDISPFTSDFIRIVIHFEDENSVDLGQGVAYVYFSQGKIKYKGYKIREYTGRYPAIGEHFIIHEESYTEALGIVKKQGNLKYL